MKKILTAILVLTIFGAMVFPYQRLHYEDGGTKLYNSLIYQYVSFNTLEGCKESKLIFGHTKRDYEYFHKKFCEPKEITITKEDKIKGESTVVGKIKFDKDAKYDVSYAGDGEVISYFSQYDAGLFQGDESLSFSNKKAEEIRDKLKLRSDNFYRDWKHPRGYNHSKKFGTLDVATVEKDGGIYYEVKKGNEKIYTSSKTTFIVEDPLKNFVNDGDDWRLLYHENKAPNTSTSYITTQDVKLHTRLIHNGEEVENYKTFGLQNIEGKVFYFFVKEKYSTVSFYYDGEIYQTDFTDIIHDRCCEPGAYNIEFSTDGRVAFWGLKGEKFSYNEMLIPGTSFGKDFVKPQTHKTENLSENKESKNQMAKEVLENEILKNLDFKFSKIIEGKTSLSDKIEIEKSFIVNISDIDPGKFKIDTNFFANNNWTELKEFSWDAFGVASWQRVYQKNNVFCLVRMQNLHNKKGNLWISCWDKKYHKNITINNKIQKNKNLTAKELLEIEILSNPMLGGSSPKPEIKKHSFKTNVFGNEEQEIENAYTVKIEELARDEFSAEKNDFTLHNWKELSVHNFIPTSERFAWRKLYQKENTTCLVNMAEKSDGSQCYDPTYDCIPVADLEITCWDK